MKPFLLGLIIGLAAIPAAAWFYLGSGDAPVATADRPFPFEHAIVKRPLHARLHKDMPKTVPISASTANLVAGADIYRRHCSDCHGLYGHPSNIAAAMYPKAPQFWVPRANGQIEAIDDPPGEIYWKVTNGVRLTGMPAFRNVLDDTARWQVSMLIAGAGKPLPSGVDPYLKQPLDTPPLTKDPLPAKP